ncbi:hypothetical protein B0H67DRAFT_54462 [Lasiosphaeris hirsuta]|uniref:Uncharacterized protein n=1 Tax=Lasiosphaeris hirsuta TaxID=260670 RepID=A0AA40BAX0_9PEZI|nr:hypothetical protein B0H67DRAFT_54462 [Lasiosphaeris hirsuta]
MSSYWNSITGTRKLAVLQFGWLLLGCLSRRNHKVAEKVRPQGSRGSLGMEFVQRVRRVGHVSVGRIGRRKHRAALAVSSLQPPSPFFLQLPTTCPREGAPKRRQIHGDADLSLPVHSIGPRGM